MGHEDTWGMCGVIPRIISMQPLRISHMHTKRKIHEDPYGKSPAIELERLGVVYIAAGSLIEN